MRFAYLLASVLLASPVVQAAPREGTLGGGKASGPVLSMSQLRSCLTQQARIQSQNDDMTRAKQQLTSERAEIDREAEALKEGLAALDRTNKEAVEAHVAKAQAHDQRIDGYQARVPEFNAKVEALQTERGAYAKACEGRRYLEDDYKDIKAGK